MEAEDMDGQDELDHQIENEYRKEDIDILEYVCGLSYNSSDENTVVLSDSAACNDDLSRDSLEEVDCGLVVQSTPYVGQPALEFVPSDVFSTINPIQTSLTDNNILKSSENNADKSMRDRIEFLELEIDAVRRENDHLKTNLDSADSELKEALVKNSEIEQKLRVSEQAYDMLLKEKTDTKSQRKLDDGQFDEIRRKLRDELFNVKESLRRSYVDLEKKNREICDYQTTVNALNQERDSLLSVTHSVVRRMANISEDLQSIASEVLTLPCLPKERQLTVQLLGKLDEERVHADRLSNILKEEYARGKDCQTSRGESILALAATIAPKLKEDSIRFLKTQDATVQTVCLPPKTSNIKVADMKRIKSEINSIRADFNNHHKLIESRLPMFSRAIAQITDLVKTRDFKYPSLVRLRDQVSDFGRDMNSMDSALTAIYETYQNFSENVELIGGEVVSLKNTVDDRYMEIDFRCQDCEGKLFELVSRKLLNTKAMKSVISHNRHSIDQIKSDLEEKDRLHMRFVAMIQEVLRNVEFLFLELKTEKDYRKKSVVTLNASVQTPASATDAELVKMVKSIIEGNREMSDLLHATVSKADLMEEWVRGAAEKLKKVYGKTQSSNRGVPNCPEAKPIRRKDGEGSEKKWYKRYIR